MDRAIGLYAALIDAINRCYAEYPFEPVIEMNSDTLKLIECDTATAWVIGLGKSQKGRTGTFMGIPIAVNNNINVLQFSIKNRYKRFQVSEEETGEYERKVSTKD